MINQIKKFNKIINKFILKIKEESSVEIALKDEMVSTIIKSFDNDYEYIKYPKTIDNPLYLALNFYKENSYKDFITIVDGIKNRKIVINNDIKNSKVNVKDNKAYLKLKGNDNDVFMLVHEFAHYIDRNSENYIIPDEFDIYSESYSIYKEKQFEEYLKKQGNYDELIKIRINNRFVTENEYLKDLSKFLYYENLYKEQGNIPLSKIDLDDVYKIMQYSKKNLGNYLLRYPFGNIVSEYLINSKESIDNKDFFNEALKMNTDSLLETLNKLIEKKNSFNENLDDDLLFDTLYKFVEKIIYPKDISEENKNHK